jgi:farnesyl-diphosphate farnesyltransferase
MPKAARDRLFVNDFIPKVSRTFALAIKFLPPRLRHSVFTAYLLCRVADTIEDSPSIAPEEKRSRLMRLRGLLNRACQGDIFDREEIAALYESVDSNAGHDYRLLTQSNELFEVLGRLPVSQQRVIYRWVGEMAGGMAEFSGRGNLSSGKIISLQDVAEWDKYCYYVAGTVGKMLTELIAGQYKIAEDKLRRMRELCVSFGLGLQKVNTIKDVPTDRQRGVIFLPLDLMRKHRFTPGDLACEKNAADVTVFVNELVAISWGHLDDAIEYTTLAPSHLRGVRMFLAVPILLAVATLNAIARNPMRAMTGPPVKISRRQVARLTIAAGRCSLSNAGLARYYEKLKKEAKILLDGRLHIV